MLSLVVYAAGKDCTLSMKSKRYRQSPSEGVQIYIVKIDLHCRLLESICVVVGEPGIHSDLHPAQTPTTFFIHPFALQS